MPARLGKEREPNVAVITRRGQCFSYRDSSIGPKNIYARRELRPSDAHFFGPLGKVVLEEK